MAAENSSPPAQTTVLIVDDEPGIVDLLRGYLQREGFRVLEAGDGLLALEIARRERPDLLILDIMLPGLDGLEVCRQTRTFTDAYILMLTARADEIDTIIGLSVGADDYMVKPFSPRELVARVRALLRRPRSGTLTHDSGARPPLRFGELEIDLDGHRVVRSGQTIALTPLEYELLTVLVSHPGMVFTRTQLVERVWGEIYGDEHVVDVHISNVRKKIERDPATPEYIETVRGIGFRFTQRHGTRQNG